MLMRSCERYDGYFGPEVAYVDRVTVHAQRELSQINGGGTARHSKGPP